MAGQFQGMASKPKNGLGARRFKGDTMHPPKKRVSWGHATVRAAELNLSRDPQIRIQKAFGNVLTLCGHPGRFVFQNVAFAPFVRHGQSLASRPNNATNYD